MQVRAFERYIPLNGSRSYIMRKFPLFIGRPSYIEMLKISIFLSV